MINVIIASMILWFPSGFNMKVRSEGLFGIPVIRSDGLFGIPVIRSAGLFGIQVIRSGRYACVCRQPNMQFYANI